MRWFWMRLYRLSIFFLAKSNAAPPTLKVKKQRDPVLENIRRRQDALERDLALTDRRKSGAHG